jgi:hypothetical protein
MYRGGLLFPLRMNSHDEIDPNCRAEKTRRVVTDLFAVCLTNALDCPHQIDVNGLRICFHPGRDQIVTQTDVSWYKQSPSVEPRPPAASAE